MTIDILIIDDSADKLDALRQTILPTFGDGDIIISEAQSIADGRDLMRKQTFDLLILDMVVPWLQDQEASRTAGKEFLTEIYENQSLHKPLQIIGLTEFEEEFNRQQQDFRDRLWYLLFYSRSNNDWKKMLKQKVIQLWNMKQSFVEGIKKRDSYDVGIICALSEEFVQMQKAFSRCVWEDTKIEGLPYTFRTTTIHTRKLHELRVIAACVGQPGVCATSILASSLYNVANVDAIYMTGITAGFDYDNLHLNDVIIADSVVDYATGKLEESKEHEGEIRLLHEIQKASASPSLVSAATSLASDEDICDDINDDLHHKNLIDRRENIMFRVAKTVCGPFVMSSPTIINALKEDDRKFQALDMEGFGLYLTAYELERKALWIKAVSDFANNHKDDSCHKSCSYASAAFLYELLREKF